ncbi:MAG: glycerophosphodiester phosphodiesterase [Candidatus Poribacteria bacterium]|nr:glycerophosphodiester phosphodiesterase [Candidatus Poribacteria bacterium]
MNIKLLAHRGGMGRAPENTLASFKQALADGADGFECDVCLTQDKQPVLIHIDFNQDDIREATGCSTPLNELNWKEVQQLKSQNSDEPVAHLDDALRFVRENQIPCFVEPKLDTPELLPIIIERIHHFDVVHLVSILTFYIRKQLLIDAKRLEPKLQTSVIFINPFANFIKAAEAIDANRIIFGWSKINHFGIYNFLTRSIPRQINELRANGIIVEAGFIQTFRDVAWALRNEVEGLWVDDVPYIRKCVEQITNEIGS